jgi:hypothetical protein
MKTMELLEVLRRKAKPGNAVVLFGPRGVEGLLVDGQPPSEQDFRLQGRKLVDRGNAAKLN